MEPAEAAGLPAEGIGAAPRPRPPAVTLHRDFHADLFDGPLSALPVLTKQRLMGNFDRLTTRSGVQLTEVEDYLAHLAGNELFHHRYYMSATAGTTGRRGVFLWDFAEWVQVVSSYNRAFDWAGSTAGLTRRVKKGQYAPPEPTSTGSGPFPSQLAIARGDLHARRYSRSCRRG